MKELLVEIFGENSFYPTNPEVLRTSQITLAHTLTDEASGIGEIGTSEQNPLVSQMREDGLRVSVSIMRLMNDVLVE